MTRKLVKAEGAHVNGTQRRKVPKRVKAELSLEDEDTFLRAAGWTREDRGEYLMYSGQLDGGEWGFIDALIKDEADRNPDGSIRSHNFLAYFHSLPAGVVNGKHKHCFGWSKRHQMIFAHYNDIPQTIQEAILSMEALIRDS